MFLAFADGYLHRQETSSREFLSRLKLLMNGCRLPIVLLIDNLRFRFLSFKLMFDLVACKDSMYFGIYLSAKITKLLV